MTIKRGNEENAVMPIQNRCAMIAYDLDRCAIAKSRFSVGA